MESEINKAGTCLIKSSNYFLNSILITLITIILIYLIPQKFNKIPVCIISSILLFYTLTNAVLQIGKAGRYLKSL